MSKALTKAFLIPWYGPWPYWMGYFLQSCRMNPTFDWIIFTDNPVPPDLPGNVAIHNFTHQELTEKASSRLDCNVNIAHPYKWVDLKPAYGLIFSDFLTGYDYWGYSDIDLVYGDIGHFLPDSLISGYDVISPSADFIPGHFCLLRNTEGIRQLFKKCSGWQQVFASPEGYFFDEFLTDKGVPLTKDSVYHYIREKSRRHIRQKKALRLIPFKKIIGRLPERKAVSPTPPLDFNSAVTASEAGQQLKVYRRNLLRDEIMNLIEGRKVIEVTWENGRLTENDKEIMYFHFQLSKYSSAIHFRRIPGRQDCFNLHTNLSGWR
jgi:hypothetical protein